VTAALLVLIAALAVGLTVISARRAGADRDVVERNRRTLDVIGAVATRPPPPPNVRRGTGVSGRRPAHARSRSPGHGHGGAVLAAVAAIGVVGLGATWYLTRHGRSGPTVTVGAPRIGATTTTTVVVPTTVVQPQVPAVVLVSHDSREADYQVQQASADVELVPSADCWVEITPASGHGPVLFAGTLPPGTRQPVPTAAGGVRVQLGNPGVMSLMVDGAPMTVPRPGAGGPFTLVFQDPAVPPVATK
jgi:Domain of unknown function (DUF4115)